MPSILIKNIGRLVTGDLKNPLRSADSIFIDNGLIQDIGNGIGRKADRVIDADGITAIPGLIDSHSHPSIGEYTPAQNSLSWITNYMHGGVTALISAGTLLLVPGLTEKDFDEIAALGIKLVKFIFYDYSLLPSGEAERYVKWARARDIRVKIHSGGVSRSGVSQVAGWESVKK